MSAPAAPLRPLLLTAVLFAAVLIQTGLGLASNQDLVPGMVDSDAHLLFHANRTFFARCVRRGELPLWNPHNLLGQPQYAAGQTGATYPPNYALYPWMRAGRALFADFTLHLVLFGLGMAALARAAGLSTAGAWTAALAATLSPLTLLRVHAGHVTVVATLAWLPWIAAGFVGLVTRTGAARPAAIAIPLGLAAHAGHIQELYYLLAFGLPAWVFWVLARRDGRGMRTLAHGGLALLLGLALGAPQLLATRELAAISSREETSFEWVQEFGSRTTDLFALFGAEAFGDRGAVPYWGRWKVWEPLPAFGFAALVLALLAPVVAPGRASLACLALVAAAVALALGHDLPLQAAAFELVPGFARFRDPARIFLIALLPLAYLAGRTADVLAAAPAETPIARPRRASLLAAFALTAALAAALFQVSTLTARLSGPQALAAVEALRHPDETFDQVDLPAVAPAARDQVARMFLRDAGMAAAIAFLCLIAAFGPRGRLALWLILGALVLEYLDAGLPFSRTHPPPLFAGEAEAWLSDRPAGSRIDLDRGFVPTLATLLETDAPGGSASLMTRWTEALLAVSQGKSPRGAAGGTVELVRHDGVARLFGVSRAVAASASGLPPPGLEHQNSPAALRRYAAPAPWPRTWLTTRVRRAASEAAELSLLSSPGFDPTMEVVVGPDTPVGAVAGLGTRTDTLPAPRALPGSANRLVFHVTLERPALLVVSDSYAPGWTARSSASPEPLRVMRVDHAFRAVLLPVGAQTVTFTYRPPGLLPGIFLAGMAVLALLIWSGFTRK